MWRPKKILIPTDFSATAAAAERYAGALAEKFGSELIHLHVIALFEYDPNNPGYQFPEMEEVYASLEKVANDRLNDMKKRVQRVKVKNLTVRGIAPAQEIIAFANEHNVDLIVMGTHGRSGVGHFLLGSVAEKVLRHVKCPVITVRQDAQSHEEKVRLQRIVVPIDFSTYSKRILPVAASIAKAAGAELEILHVIEERVHPAYYVSGETSIFKLIPDLREKSQMALKQFVDDQIPEGVGYTLHIREGRAFREIVTFADEHAADMIAISTNGLSGLEHLLLGSTTEKVIRKSPVPVLTIKAS